MAVLHTIRKAFAPIAILFGALAIAFYLVNSRPQAKSTPLTEVGRPVSVLTVEFRDITPTIVNFGEVVATREAEMRAMVAGRLTFIADEFKDGAVIRAGTKIAVVDPFEYELGVREGRANLTEAQARLSELRSEKNGEQSLLNLARDQVELRERDFERSQRLVKKGQSSEKALDDAEIALNIANESIVQRARAIEQLGARIAQQQAVVERREAELRKAGRDLEDTVINAPFDGYVTETGLALGKRVAAGESLGRLISGEGLQVRFQLNNNDYARLIAQGRADILFSRAVSVTWRLGDEAFAFKGHIERRAAEIDPAMGGVTVYASIQDGQTLDALRPGAFVEVSLDDVDYRNAFEMPSEAVFDGNVVFSVVEGRLKPQTIDVLREIGGTAIVRGDFPAGTQIVTSSFPEIGPGVLVRVINDGGV